ncbi:MAG: hypothetical protein ACYCW6_00105 [Candidatus Xenobia bacterium]
MLSLISIFFALAQALFALVTDHETSGASGAAKRAAVLADAEQLLAAMPAPAGPAIRLVPKSLQDWLVGLFVDRLVAAANKSGFFGHSATGGQPPAPPLTSGS